MVNIDFRRTSVVDYCEKQIAKHDYSVLFEEIFDNFLCEKHEIDSLLLKMKDIADFIGYCNLSLRDFDYEWIDILPHLRQDSSIFSRYIPLMEWIEKKASIGDANAIYILGIFKYIGFATPIDKEEGLNLLEKVMYESADALFQIALLNKDWKVLLMLANKDHAPASFYFALARTGIVRKRFMMRSIGLGDFYSLQVTLQEVLCDDEDHYAPYLRLIDWHVMEMQMNRFGLEETINVEIYKKHWENSQYCHEQLAKLS